MQASAGNYASYRRQHVDAKTDSDVVADSTGLTVVDTNNNNNNNTNNNNIIIINNEKKKKQLSDAVRPPKTQQEITTLRKLTPKEQRKKSRNETQLMQTIPFLNISKTMDAMYLLIATMAMNDIKEQQQFEHASTNNILNFAGGALDLLLSHNRTRTTKTIAQLHDLFTQYTPTIIIDPPTTNDSTNNNKRRNTLLASDIVDAKIRVLLRSFVVDKATHTVTTSIDPTIESKLILSSMATLGTRFVSTFVTSRLKNNILRCVRRRRRRRQTYSKSTPNNNSHFSSPPKSTRRSTYQITNVMQRSSAVSRTACSQSSTPATTTSNSFDDTTDLL